MKVIEFEALGLPEAAALHRAFAEHFRPRAPGWAPALRKASLSSAMTAVRAAANVTLDRFTI